MSANFKKVLPKLEVCFSTPVATACAKLTGETNVFGILLDSVSAQETFNKAKSYNGLKFVACDVHRQCRIFSPSYSDAVDKFGFEQVFASSLPADFWQTSALIFDNNIPAKWIGGGLYLVDSFGQVFQVFNYERASLLQFVASSTEEVAKREVVVDELREQGELFFKGRYDYPTKKDWIKKNSFKMSGSSLEVACPNPFELFTATGVNPFQSDARQNEIGELEAFCFGMISWGASLNESYLKTCVEETTFKLKLGEIIIENGGKRILPGAYYERNSGSIVLCSDAYKGFLRSSEYFARTLAHECEHKKFNDRFIRSEYGMIVADAMSHLKADLIEDAFYYGIADWFTKWYSYKTLPEVYDEEICAYSAGFMTADNGASYSVPAIEKRLAQICELLPRDGALFILNRTLSLVMQDESIAENVRFMVAELIKKQIEFVSSDS